MHIHQYLQSRIIIIIIISIIIIQRHVSATPVTVISVSYNRNTEIMQIFVQNCMLILLIGCV